MTSSGPYGSDPDVSWGGRDPSRSGGDPYGGAAGSDPYGVGSASDPYAADPYAPDPHAPGPYASDPYAPGPQDPLAAPGYSPGGFTPVHSGPQFGDRVGYGPVYVPPASSSMAITGFVLGLLSVTICSGLTGPFGLFFSLRGMKDTDPAASPAAGGRGLAIAGLVTSIIGTLILLALIAYVVVIVAVVVTAPSTY